MNCLFHIKKKTRNRNGRHLWFRKYETFAKGYEFRGVSTNGTDILSIAKGRGITFMG